MAVPAALRPPFARPAAAADWPGLASSVLDLLHDAVLVTAHDLTLLGANRAARRLLREGDGLSVSPHGLVTARQLASHELRRGIESAARGEVRRMEVPRPGRAPLELLLEPHPRPPGEAGAAVIFATDPEQDPRPSAPALAARYGLTPAECDVAKRLAAGAGLERIAAELGITLHTVRGHLKHVYLKAGVHRQAELVARLLSEA